MGKYKLKDSYSKGMLELFPFCLREEACRSY
ncbi:MAG: hypothetical protein ACI86L_001838, partial [Dokdonia sp.]